MPDEVEARQLARDALQGGKLPRRPPDRIWGGYGIDLPCAVCQRSVARAEVEYEIQFGNGDDGTEPSLDRYHLHLRCFAAWEMERTKP
jgi:hypothetical protein